jgi:hypothetical protein
MRAAIGGLAKWYLLAGFVIGIEDAMEALAEVAEVAAG